mmetsp:Transcript_35649/g.65573  ORF Transcript_35649/g.65573 Transcript_35649/m.65573 type:complete len:244 (-) Transcript_35649:305-1036(-)
MGLTQTKLHFKILKEKWPSVISRVSTPEGKLEASTQNPLGDLPLHYACYTGRAPPSAIRALLGAYPAGAAVRNKHGFTALEVAEVNYRMDGSGWRYRAEVLDVLRLATTAAERVAAHGGPARTATVAATMPEEIYRTSPDCVVCMDKPATVLAVPCGHLCLCPECSVQVRECRVCPVGRCFVAGGGEASTAMLSSTHSRVHLSSPPGGEISASSSLASDQGSGRNVGSDSSFVDEPRAMVQAC